MRSPAQRHYHRVMAEKAAASAAPGESLAGASAYELMLAKLAIDKKRLKSIASIQKKIDVKRAELLPEYVDYVAGALAGGRGAQDDVLTTILVWRIDAGDYAGALDIARYALKHRMTMPDQYDRPLATAIAEEFAEAAIAAFKRRETFDRAQLEEVAQLTASADMHDQVRAKLHKAAGYAAEIAGDNTAAFEHLCRALALDSRAGVKQDIARLEKARDAAGGDAGRK
ncbi:phage terminase small subunit [Paraburkholderia lycopersici]|uniref:Phage small terminase subunit n=1 Tax=Paraburkholderia lycopersici TaxID=416944 RepID=A0A1G7CPZ2_9BURK|nr:phage terminase small subunit [Paraburkholderia lycopersici]SDE41412.1 Phage small terminase subunit [Paraburkholderia lycopersici]